MPCPCQSLRLPPRLPYGCRGVAGCLGPRYGGLLRTWVAGLPRPPAHAVCGSRHGMGRRYAGRSPPCPCEPEPPSAPAVVMPVGVARQVFPTVETVRVTLVAMPWIAVSI